MDLVKDVRASYARLATAQKPAAGVPFYMRAVNRRLGRLIAAMVARLGRTPNQMTAVSGLSFLAGMVVLLAFEPSVRVALCATVLLQLGFAFDAADGQLARLTGTGSPAGEWLDHVVDAARILVLHLGVAVGLHLHTDVTAAWLLLPLGFAVVASVRFFAHMLADQLSTDAGPGSTGRVGGWIQTPADAGVVNLVFLLWPWTSAFLAGYVVLAAGNALLLLATLLRRHRSLRSGATS
jgi:phosphatidylglycerophosphate synthase